MPRDTPVPPPHRHHHKHHHHVVTPPSPSLSQLQCYKSLPRDTPHRIITSITLTSSPPPSPLLSQLKCYRSLPRDTPAPPPHRHHHTPHHQVITTTITTTFATKESKVFAPRPSCPTTTSSSSQANNARRHSLCENLGCHSCCSGVVFYSAKSWRLRLLAQSTHLSSASLLKKHQYRRGRDAFCIKRNTPQSVESINACGTCNGAFVGAGHICVSIFPARRFAHARPRRQSDEASASLKILYGCDTCDGARLGAERMRVSIFSPTVQCSR